MKPSQLAEEMLSLADERGAEQFSAGSVPPDCARGLLSPKRPGELLSYPLLRHPQVRIASAGKGVPSREYVARRRISTQWVDDAIDEVIFHLIGRDVIEATSAPL